MMDVSLICHKYNKKNANGLAFSVKNEDFANFETLFAYFETGFAN
jgi:hypothetical protein